MVRRFLNGNQFRRATVFEEYKWSELGAGRHACAAARVPCGDGWELSPARTAMRCLRTARALKAARLVRAAAPPIEREEAEVREIAADWMGAAAFCAILRGRPDSMGLFKDRNDSTRSLPDARRSQPTITRFVTRCLWSGVGRSRASTSPEHFAPDSVRARRHGV